jgi:NAD dependent epimerase/dehydratase family
MLDEPGILATAAISRPLKIKVLTHRRPVQCAHGPSQTPPWPSGTGGLPVARLDGMLISVQRCPSQWSRLAFWSLARTGACSSHRSRLDDAAVLVIGASGAIGSRLVPQLIEHGHEVVGSSRPAIYNITDDEPAPARDYLPVLADALDARPSRRLPLWLAGLFMGESLPMMTESRGASNVKARRELGWTLRYPTWRQGFPAAFARPDRPRTRV